MFSQPVVFVDIETNGQMGSSGRIIEIGILRVENGEITDTFASLVNPGSSVPVWIERLTGITNRELADAPYFDELADEIQKLLDGAIFVAHNVRFDFSFVKSHLKALDITYNPKLFCTVRMSRALYPEHKGHSLEKIIARHNITTGARHRAYDDAKAAFDFMQLAIKEKGMEAFEENVRLQLRTRSLPPHVNEASINALPASPGIYFFNDQDGRPLYIGKSINIRSRVRSHFAGDTNIVKEMKLSQRSYSIDFIQTDTEIEALLLESAKVKELQPIFNRQLRRKSMQSVLMKKMTDDGYITIRIEDRDLGELTNMDDVYGVYPSKRNAKAALETAAKTFQLCPKLLALEKASGACFRYQLGLCKGACLGKEAPELYNRRVELALERSKVESWPFASKIAIRISDAKSLIVNQWIIEGIVHHEFEPVFKAVSNGFDIDTYKILRSFVRTHKSKIVLLNDQAIYG